MHFRIPMICSIYADAKIKPRMSVTSQHKVKRVVGVDFLSHKCGMENGEKLLDSTSKQWRAQSIILTSPSPMHSSSNAIILKSAYNNNLRASKPPLYLSLDTTERTRQFATKYTVRIKKLNCHFIFMHFQTISFD